MLLSVIIVHFRVPQFLEQCICSLETALIGLEAEVIVVDNDDVSGDTASIIDSSIPVKWMAAEKNIGFAAACNLGWSSAAGKWVLLLNPDTLVTAAAIRGCITQIENDDTIGAIGCRLINGNGNFLPESKRSFPTPINAAAKILGLAHLFPTSRLFNHYALGNVAATTSCSVEVLTGAFLLTSRNMLEYTNGLDEMYFLYGEDIDFCKKVVAAGKQCWYRGTDSIIHFKGASSPAKGRPYFYHFYRAMRVYCNKYYATPIRQVLRFFIYVQWMLHQLSWKLAQCCKTDTNHTDFLGEVICVGSEEDTAAVSERISKKQGKAEPIRVYNWQEWTLNAGSGFSKDSKGSLIFCLGTLTLQTVIQWLESNPLTITVFFMHANTKAMVGKTGSRVLTKKAM